MTVVYLQRNPDSGAAPWRPAELNHMVALFAEPLSTGDAGGWAVGATETGDAQFYLLSQPPAEDCILCISRIGNLYILEDGAGQVLFEHNDLMRLADQAKHFLRRNKSSIVARAILLWCALRHTFHEKVEPVLAEAEETIVHLAPQFAALA